MKKLALCLVLIILSTIIVACAKQKTRDYIGRQGEYRITVPGSWEEIDELNEDADLCLGDKESSRFLVILGEKKSGFSPQFVADDYYEHAKETLILVHEDCEILQEDPFAFQFTAKANIDGVAVKFFVSVKESNDKFWQLIFWSEADDFEEAYSEFVNISDGFNATDGISLDI